MNDLYTKLNMYLLLDQAHMFQCQYTYCVQTCTKHILNKSCGSPKLLLSIIFQTWLGSTNNLVEHYISTMPKMNVVFVKGYGVWKYLKMWFFPYTDVYHQFTAILIWNMIINHWTFGYHMDPYGTIFSNRPTNLTKEVHIPSGYLT
jgi:hypothetical protein